MSRDMGQGRWKAKIITDVSKTHPTCSLPLTWATLAHQPSSRQNDPWWVPATDTKQKAPQWTRSLSGRLPFDAKNSGCSKNMKLRLFQERGSLQTERSASYTWAKVVNFHLKKETHTHTYTRTHTSPRQLISKRKQIINLLRPTPLGGFRGRFIDRGLTKTGS